MLNLEKALTEKYPDLPQKIGGKAMMKLIKTLTHETEINDFIQTHQHLKGFAFLDHVLNFFNFSYQVSARSLNRIPSEGRLMIVANHPIGSLDGLALLKMVRSIRPDVRIVANDLLNNIAPLQSLFLGMDNMSGPNTAKTTHKAQFKAIMHALENDEAVIIFPAGEVSRIRPNGVRDGKWKTGFLKFAQKAKAPIVPIFIDARNSALFYTLSAMYKPLGTLLLVQEMFNKNHQEITFHIGKPIAYKAINRLELPNKALASRFRKHLYTLDKESKTAKKGHKANPPLFETLETIAHPVDRKALKKALKKSPLLGQTQDGKKIYLYDFEDDSPVMHEIGRLRELTFRTVEEGTGTRMDLDAYDVRYRHLVLWDEDDLEIVGAYRIGECKQIIDEHGTQGLYTSTLFNLQPQMEALLPNALELGRSFVQPRYWGKRSLDYLWYGIGAYVALHPDIKYLFGPVSLSAAYPQNAKELIMGFYSQQFGSNPKQTKSVTAIRPIKLSPQNQNIAEHVFNGEYKASYKKLNALLDAEGVKVPTLFKQYAEVCDDKGCQFIDFSIDPNFNNCIDAFILVDLDKLTPKKRARYLNPISA